MQWIAPELRENRGELEAAREQRLPQLIELDDIRGDLHMPLRPPPTATPSIEEMAGPRASAATSTSRSPTTRPRTASATTCSPTSCCARSSTSAGSSSRASPCWPAPRPTCCPTARSTTRTTCWRSSTGSSPACTRRSGWARKQTERMIAAMEHPLVDAIGHPTGRLIERREPYAIDIERGDRGRGRDRHLPRDQRQPRPPRPQRRLRAAGGGGRGDAGDRLRRPLAAHAGQHALRRGNGAARVADHGPGGQHPALEAASGKLRKRGRGLRGCQHARGRRAPSIFRRPGSRSSSGAPNGELGRSRTPRRRGPRSPRPRATACATAARSAGSSRWRSPAPAGRRSPPRPRRRCTARSAARAG